MTNSNRAKVSVCIPVYGVEKYIERCARSLFEQTMKEDIEFIFVNDCTKDKSIEILEQVLSEYPGRKNQVKIIHHEKNKGLVAARKTGLAHASGDYIIHCDSDDWVDLNMYESMYNKAIEANVDMVYCSLIKENSSGWKKLFSPYIADSVKEYIRKNFGGDLNSLCTKLYKREFALDDTINCPDYITVGEDLLCNSQILLNCKKIAFDADVLYHYWVHSESIMHDVSPKYFQCLQDIIDILTEKKADYFQKELERIKSMILIGILENYYVSSEDARGFYLTYWRNTKNKWSIFLHSIGFYKRSVFILGGLINFHLTVYLLHLLNANRH